MITIFNFVDDFHINGILGDWFLKIRSFVIRVTKESRNLKPNTTWRFYGVKTVQL